MSEAPDRHELARRLAVLEERMNTHQATYETALERLERRMAERDAQRDVEAAKRDAEAAKRDKDNVRWQTTLFIATVGVIGIATAILGFLIRFPPAAAV